MGPEIDWYMNWWMIINNVRKQVVWLVKVI
jgi:hypothetical protein